MRIAGQCHCGNITLGLDWPAEARIPARACTCTFCQKHGGLWTSHPDAVLTVRIADPARVSRYQFGTRTADFHVCSQCGVAPVVTSRIEGRLHAVVSVRALEGVDPSRVDATQAATFDAETETTRLARRARHWIGRVDFPGAGT
jgi:hypothetical protein